MLRYPEAQINPQWITPVKGSRAKVVLGEGAFSIVEKVVRSQYSISHEYVDRSDCKVLCAVCVQGEGRGHLAVSTQCVSSSVVPGRDTTIRMGSGRDMT